MSAQVTQIGTAKASPTKEFFVNMLTRDIELQDALLDLLDNCVDGIVRSGKADPVAERPYQGFQAVMTLSKDHFSIEDNCGGIPYDIAQKYAFAMGRPPTIDVDEAQGTVGMYGIGMKRAIFKIGTDALIESRNDVGFYVEITPEWMAEDKWGDLPVYELADTAIPVAGTRILVTKLRDDIATTFSNNDWIDEFRKAVARHYALIIEKGFEVTVGSPKEIESKIAPIEAEPFRLLTAKSDNGEGLSPYIYTGTLHDVTVEIYAGLYRHLLTEEELDGEDETRGNTDDAGWTVACNDRVVIWKDKTKLTGWGEATVPIYHGQFIAITGLVVLRSADPKKLPLTTTKRGIDGASLLYLDVKDLMREATKALTAFTNKWKKFPSELETIYRSSSYADLPTLRASAATAHSEVMRKYPDIKKVEALLPAPHQQKTSSRISFVALNKDIEDLAYYFFEDRKMKASAVGEQAFIYALEESKK